MFQAFPLSSKDTDSVKEALDQFIGTQAKNPQTICKSDCAKELFIRSLNWWADVSLPRRWPRNSVLERQTRAFEESCRSMHLQAGFAVAPMLWTLTCQNTAVSVSIEQWSKAFGFEFKGASYILGQLVVFPGVSFKLSQSWPPIVLQRSWEVGSLSLDAATKEL